jgi:hypothetical protein
MEDATEASVPAPVPDGVMEAVKAEPQLPAAVAPAQLREDMIQNALSFLGHPKVRDLLHLLLEHGRLDRRRFLAGQNGLVCVDTTMIISCEFGV